MTPERLDEIKADYDTDAVIFGDAPIALVVELLDHINELTEERSALIRKRSASGVLGGKARSAKLTPKKRKAIAVKAAKSRWAKYHACVDKQ